MNIIWCYLDSNETKTVGVADLKFICKILIFKILPHSIKIARPITIFEVN